MDSDFELWGEKWLHLMVKIITTCYHRLSTTAAAAAGCDMVEKFWCVRISTFFPTFLYTRKSTNLFQPIFSHGSKHVAAPPSSSYKFLKDCTYTLTNQILRHLNSTKYAWNVSSQAIFKQSVFQFLCASSALRRRLKHLALLLLGIPVYRFNCAQQIFGLQYSKSNWKTI